MPDEHCWWAVFRTPLPLDTVAARFTRAYADVGLTSPTLTRLADTVVLHAGPTDIVREGAVHRFSARMVAYRRGDSTHFRHYVALGPSAAKSPRNEGSLAIGMCGEIARASQTHATAPAQPDGEERLDVWSRQ